MTDEEFMQMLWDNMSDPYTGNTEEWIEKVAIVRAVDRQNYRRELLEELIEESDDHSFEFCQSWLRSHTEPEE